MLARDSASNHSENGVDPGSGVNHITDASAGKVRPQIETGIGLVERASVLVNEPRLRISQYNGRVVLQDVQAAGQIVRFVNIVSRRPLEILSPGSHEQIVIVVRQADVLAAAIVPNSWVLGGIGPANRLGLVGRGIIRDDQLKIGIALS